MNDSPKIRVLVVDDSAVARRTITGALNADPGIEVVGTASDPYIARDLILELNPDVLTLDIEMPRMDGLSFLRIIQKHRPMPVVIISSVAQAQSKAALQALEAGAVDVLAKPTSAWSIGELAKQLPGCIKAAATARVKGVRTGGPAAASEKLAGTGATYHPRQVVLLGASTGGVEALTSVLSRLPDGLPGICIVQHIPPVFSRSFSERLNELCAFEVREAQNGDDLRPGLALVAPGESHMKLDWKGSHYRVVLTSTPPVNFVRPAVDVLFESAVTAAGRFAVAGLLTGMGRDGAQGLKHLRDAGATTFAQNEETCVVYGMPGAAAELGAVDRLLPLQQIPQGILVALNKHAGSKTPQPLAGSHSI